MLQPLPLLELCLCGISNLPRDLESKSRRLSCAVPQAALGDAGRTSSSGAPAAEAGRG